MTNIGVVRAVPQLLRTLESLRYPNGLFASFPARGVQKIDIFENCHIITVLREIDQQMAVRATHALLDVLLRNADLLTTATKDQVPCSFTRVHPYTLQPTQHTEDLMTIGMILFTVGEGLSLHSRIIRTREDAVILQQVIDYLIRIEYWHQPDCGPWGMPKRLHAATIAACVAGLKALQPYLFVPQHVIAKGQRALLQVLRKDLKQPTLNHLTLVWPLRMVSPRIVLPAVEALVRERGCIRFVGDQEGHRINGEAEWPLGFAWLAFLYQKLGNVQKERFFREKLRRTIVKGMIPRWYAAATRQHNGHLPYAWGQALLLAYFAQR